MNAVGTLNAIDDYLDALLDDSPRTPAGKSLSGDVGGGVATPVCEPVRDPTPGTVPSTTPAAKAPETHAPATRAPVAQAPASVAQVVHGAPTPQRWLRVKIGDDSYAMELLCVQEVVRMAPIVAMRGVGRAVLGVMNLRGRIVPVFDLGLWLGAGCVHGDDRSRIVVVERDDELIGVLVSAVEDVITLGRDRIEPPLASSDAGAVIGIARAGATPTVLLDTHALFG